VLRTCEHICDTYACSISKDIQAERALCDHLSKDDRHLRMHQHRTYLHLHTRRVPRPAETKHADAVGEYIFGSCYACCRMDIGGEQFGQQRNRAPTAAARMVRSSVMVVPAFAHR
jgi:hypothetical protein